MGGRWPLPQFSFVALSIIGSLADIDPHDVEVAYNIFHVFTRITARYHFILGQDLRVEKYPIFIRFLP